MCHGPEKNIGCVPETNAGVMSNPSGTAFGERPSLKYDWYSVNASTACWLFSVNLPWPSVMSPPYDQRNGAYSCQFLVPREMPHCAPPFDCRALAIVWRSANV